MKLLRLLMMALAALPARAAEQADGGPYAHYYRILQEENDSVRCRQLINYGALVADSLHDYNFALLIFKKADAALQQSPYPSLQLRLLRYWARTYYDKGDYAAADKLYVKALAMKGLEKDPTLKAVLLNSAAVNLQDLAVYKRALIYYHEALELYTQLNNTEGKGSVYLNMANIFALVGDLQKSDQFFDKAMQIFLQHHLMEYYATSLGNKAYIKHKLGMPDSAKVLIRRSLNIDLGPQYRPGYVIERYFNLGLLYNELKQWDSCFWCLNRGKALADSAHLGERMTGTYYNDMAFCYAFKGESEKAIHYYKQALRIRSGIADYKQLYHNISELYFKNKQYDSAFLYKNKGIVLADSIYNSELKEHIAFEDKRVELLEKDYQNQISSALQQQTLNRLANRNYLLVGVVIVLVILVLLLFLYFRQYRLRAKKEQLQSELDFLRAQLNPHFLFNSINNIYVLLDENKDRASAILLKFSELMRYQLYECNVSKIQLKRELQFLENYMEFEKLRYSNKLEVHCELPADVPDELMIAPLLLQPFIENAFKHTPKTREQQGQIHLRIALETNVLVFEVSNTRDSRAVSGLPGGIGLGNVRKRLKLLYASQHDLKISATDHLYKIILKLNLNHD